MRRYLLIFALSILSWSAFAFDSPAPDGRLMNSFAQDSYGRFNTGQEIQSQNVYASEDGEIVFYGREMIAIQHADRIMTIYSNVEPIDNAVRGNYVRRGQLIGKAIRGVFHFDVLDTEMNRYINPSLMIERVKKSELPKVLGIEFNRSLGVLEVKLDNRGMSNLYSLQVLMDGKQVYDLRFETMSVSDGELRLGGTGFSYRELYKSSGVFSFVKMPFKEGDNYVEIKVKDFYGKTIIFSGIIKI